MKLDALRFMQALAADIGIDPAFYEEYKFVVQNETINRRSHWLHHVGRRIKLFLPKSRLTRPLIRLYRRWQRSSSPSGRTIDESLALARLMDHSRPYNARLADEFSIDLSLWERACIEQVANEGLEC
jgi:GH25 family lysozyme M1 (1,4-beta-N-acetylmuramidase)